MLANQIPIDSLLAALPDPMPELARALQALVKRAEPEAIEAVRPGWRIIGYDMPLGLGPASDGGADSSGAGRSRAGRGRVARRRRSVFFAWIMAQPEHVHLGFPRGVHMSDPMRVLEGEGVTKLARWVTVRSMDDVEANAALFEELVHEAADNALIPRAARLAGVVRFVDPTGERGRRPG